MSNASAVRAFTNWQTHTTHRTDWFYTFDRWRGREKCQVGTSWTGERSGATVVWKSLLGKIEWLGGLYSAHSTLLADECQWGMGMNGDHLLPIHPLASSPFWWWPFIVGIVAIYACTGCNGIIRLRTFKVPHSPFICSVYSVNEQYGDQARVLRQNLLSMYCFTMTEVRM